MAKGKCKCRFTTLLFVLVVFLFIATRWQCFHTTSGAPSAPLASDLHVHRQAEMEEVHFQMGLTLKALLIYVYAQCK